MLGIAVKTAAVPVHIVVFGVEIVTEGTMDAETVIVIVAEFAVDFVVQFAVLVIIHDIASLLIKLASEYVAVLFPTLIPFFVHW